MTRPSGPADIFLRILHRSTAFCSCWATYSYRITYRISIGALGEHVSRGMHDVLAEIGKRVTE